jgi:hypothetical protein
MWIGEVERKGIRENDGNMDWRGGLKESIEGFIEDRAFLRLYESAQHPPPFPFSCQQVFSLSQSSSVSPVELTDRRDRGIGVEPNHTTARKLGPL